MALQSYLYFNNLVLSMDSKEEQKNKPYLFEIISLECRWFFKRAVPLTLAKLFEGTDQEIRTDVYWIKGISQNSNETNNGVKLREGRLEIKKKIEEMLVPEIPGIVQKWKKTGQLPPQIAKIDTDWLKITKKRKLNKYKIENGHISGPVVEYPSSGCNFELTLFEKPFEKYATVGFEAYGKEQNLLENLLITFNEIIKVVGSGEVFISENSKSYPEWLAELGGVWKS